MSSDDWMDFLSHDNDMTLVSGDGEADKRAFVVGGSTVRPFPRAALQYAVHQQPPSFSLEETVETACSRFKLDVLYDRNGERAMVVEEKCKTVIVEAFSTCLNGHVMAGYDTEDMTFAEVLDAIKQTSNYDIMKIESVRNDQQSGMHSSFKTLYGIESPRTVYHGTSLKSSENIARKGFRGAVSVRAKFGKGIYTSSSVWEVIAYAEPTGDSMCQTFLVVSLLQGPTCIGSVNMADFGYDKLDRPILTSTNPGNTIFGASHGSQLLSTYRVTVRYDRGVVAALSHKNLVQIYNPVIWSHISPPVAVVVPVQAKLVMKPVARSKPVDTVRVVQKPKHRGIAVGDMVDIVKNDAVFDFSKGHKGYVRHILKYNHYRFYIEVDDPHVQTQMQLHYVSLNATDRYRNVNKAFNVKDTLVPCSFPHIVKKT